MSFQITDACVACQACTKACPQKAIHFDGDRFEIDQEKCVGCGTCYRTCQMRAIIDTEHPEVEPELDKNRPAEQECDFLVLGSGPAGPLLQSKKWFDLYLNPARIGVG